MQGWMLRKRLWSVGWVAVLVTVAAVLAGPDVRARGVGEEPVSQVVAVIALGALPPQGQEVWQQIHRGGPFRYEKDGTVFGNRERLLPIHKRGYYREYTVPTPGLSHRGARRIVCGGQRPQQPDACYYTADHYASFKRIVQ